MELGWEGDGGLVSGAGEIGIVNKLIAMYSDTYLT